MHKPAGCVQLNEGFGLTMLTTTIHLAFLTYNWNTVDWRGTEFIIQIPTSEGTGRSHNFILQVSSQIASTHAGCLEFKPSLAGVNADVRYGGLLSTDRQTVKQIGCRQQIGIRHENLEGKSSVEVLNVDNYRNKLLHISVKTAQR